MRFNYDCMISYLNNGTDQARREAWPLSDRIVLRDGTEHVDGRSYVSSDEDREAEDWIVYRRG